MSLKIDTQFYTARHVPYLKYILHIMYAIKIVCCTKCMLFKIYATQNVSFTNPRIFIEDLK